MAIEDFALSEEELRALQAAAAEQEDQTEESGSFERAVPLPGKRLCRLIEYVEYGMHSSKPGKFGQKPPAEIVRLVFELLGPNDMTEFTKDDTVERHGHRLTLRLRKSKSSKSDFKKVLNQLIGGRNGIVHFAQLVGQGFIVRCTCTDAEGKPVVPNNPKEADSEFKAKAKYLNAWAGDKDAKQWQFELPIAEDPTTGEMKPYKVPPATYQLRVFLFNAPNMKCWMSLYIDGEREGKDENGNTVKVSKNFLQEEVLKAVNFPGSPVEIMLAEAGVLEETLKAAGLREKPAGVADDDFGPGFPAGGVDDSQVPF